MLLLQTGALVIDTKVINPITG